ncbi:MAG: transporter, family, multidrug resistance protein, partial [Rhodospirillaceae bacterium]|nr:transporter, family, multidrug resistance protein [Rhodospirillaceae bacterium]
GLALVGAAGSGHLFLLLIPLWIAVASVGFATTNAVAIAMAASGPSAGSASALIGVLQYGAGALAGALVGWLHDGTAYPMALVIAGLGLAGIIAHLLGGAPFRGASER